MSIILTFILAQLCLIYVSAMAIPPMSAATIPIWDIERATSFDTLLVASLKHTQQAHSSKTTSSQSAKTTKKRIAARKAKHLPSIKNGPMSGMQCAVM